MSVRDNINPRLTIILPIGDARPTLTNTINSVLLSDSYDFELLVSDNTQGKVTFEKQHLEDSRVRLISNPIRLSMSDHWRKLIETSAGEWVCFMGADDGIVTQNLPKLLRVLQTTEYKVVSTHRVEIEWDENFYARAWTFPASKCSEKISVVYWPTWLSSLFPHFFFDLPMPYNKAVFRREEIEEFLNKQHKLFDLTPDYFLAFFLGYKTKKGLFLDIPIFVHGGSENSNGYQSKIGNETESSRDFLNRIDVDLQVAKNLPTECQGAWLANSFLLNHFQGKENIKVSRWQSINRVALSKFYQVWVRITCVSCRTHLSRNSKWMITIKKIIIDKLASLIRSYILPIRRKHRLPEHPGRHESGSSFITLENLETYL